MDRQSHGKLSVDAGFRHYGLEKRSVDARDAALPATVANMDVMVATIATTCRGEWG